MRVKVKVAVPAPLPGSPAIASVAETVTVGNAGGGAVKVKAFGTVVLSPPGVVTIIGTVPLLVTDGVTAVSDAALLMVTLGAAAVPNVTEVPATNPDPSMFTAVPPTIGPLVGLILETTGIDSTSSTRMASAISIFVVLLRNRTRAFPEVKTCVPRRFQPTPRSEKSAGEVWRFP